MSHVQFRGHSFNQRTITMIREAERNLRFTLEILQGSFNGSVGASAGTHAGGGAADFAVAGRPVAQRQLIVRELRRVGFAAWLRKKGGSFALDHIHAIGVGDPQLSSAAAAQVTDYRKGRNGLADDGPDNGPREFVGRTFEQYVALRRTPDATAASTEADKKRDRHLTVRAMRMAAAGTPISHTFAFDAEQFMAFAFTGLKVIAVENFRQWRRTRESELFVDAVKRVQHHLGVPADGDPGPATLDKLHRFGYFITP